MPALLHDFLTGRGKGCTIYSDEMPTDRIAAGLRDGRFDLGLGSVLPPEDALEQIPFAWQPLCLLTPPGDSAAYDSPAALNGAPLITFRQDYPMARLLAERFAAWGCTPHPASLHSRPRPAGPGAGASGNPVNAQIPAGCGSKPQPAGICFFSVLVRRVRTGRGLAKDLGGKEWQEDYAVDNRLDEDIEPGHGLVADDGGAGIDRIRLLLNECSSTATQTLPVLRYAQAKKMPRHRQVMIWLTKLCRPVSGA